MNYFLVFVILVVCGGSYYMHTQDQQQIDSLQKQLTDETAKETKLSDSAKESSASSTNAASGTAAATLLPSSQPSAPAAVLLPDTSHSSAIDSAAAAATSAANSASMGTITTLDGRTFQDCKVLKVEPDGVTFNHADGITKVLFPLLPPDIQKKFGYDPQKAVATSAAEVKYQQQSQQADASPTNSGSANP